jgi:hypothetical protein
MVMTAKFKNSTARSASQPDAQNLKFERPDWTSFRTPEGLQQKAGVPASRLRRLVLKELADNALDSGAYVRVSEMPDGTYLVEDTGPGIDGTPEEIAHLFSISRPMISTKQLRMSSLAPYWRPKARWSSSPRTAASNSSRSIATAQPRSAR